MDLQNIQNNHIYVVDTTTGKIIDTISNEKHFKDDAGFQALVEKRKATKKTAYPETAAYILLSEKIKVIVNDLSFGDNKDYRVPFQIVMLSAIANGTPVRTALDNLVAADLIEEITLKTPAKVEGTEETEEPKSE